MAHSQRGWTGARTPSAIKNVRRAERRHAVNQPRRTAAKTLVSRALASATDAVSNGGDAQAVRDAVERATSALDRAAKVGAIHQNAASRRKSRLMLKVNAALGGEIAAAPAQARSTSKAQAAKQARVRIAASRASKAKGEQTAAGKARAALARSSRAAADATQGVAEASAEPETAEKPARRSATRSAAGRASTAKKSATKASTTKASATKASAGKSAAKLAARSSTKAAEKKS